MARWNVVAAIVVTIGFVAAAAILEWSPFGEAGRYQLVSHSQREANRPRNDRETHVNPSPFVKYDSDDDVLRPDILFFDTRTGRIWQGQILKHIALHDPNSEYKFRVEWTQLKPPEDMDTVTSPHHK